MTDDRAVVALTAGEPIATQRDATHNAQSVDQRLDDAAVERRRLIRVILLFCFLTVVLGSANYIKVSHQGQQAAESRVVIQANTDRIKDCTDPTGKCFKEGQARTAAAIVQLNQFNRLSVGCAKAIPTGTPADAALAAIDKCIAARTPKQPR